MAQVNWNWQALEDLVNIAEFISKDSPFYATIQLERFFEAALVLEKFPEYGKPVPETDRSDIREILVGNY